MTTAPATLLACRKLLLSKLDMHPGKAVNADLDPAEVGIVGDTAHVVSGDSYHLGRPQQRLTGYAATESPRDKAGLCEFASALDVGEFSVSVAGKAHNLRSFSTWLVAQCKANTPDTRDIREVIYSPDGKTVKRWDRLNRRSSGDNTHLWHTHISFFRDATKANRDQTPLLRRYLTTIGLIKETHVSDLTLNDINAIRWIDGRVRALAEGTDKVADDAAAGAGRDVWIVQEMKKQTDLLVKIAVAVGAGGIDYHPATTPTQG